MTSPAKPPEGINSLVPEIAKPVPELVFDRSIATADNRPFVLGIMGIRNDISTYVLGDVYTVQHTMPEYVIVGDYTYDITAAFDKYNGRNMVTLVSSDRVAPNIIVHYDSGDRNSVGYRGLIYTTISNARCLEPAGAYINRQETFNETLEKRGEFLAARIPIGDLELPPWVSRMGDHFQVHARGQFYAPSGHLEIHAGLFSFSHGFESLVGYSCLRDDNGLVKITPSLVVDGIRGQEEYFNRLASSYSAKLLNSPVELAG
ncbi:hypothetical protein KAZ57_01775 [Patescibacteria group bacterium]|nr:hypothetical protein [Patescibacteria group bacterium]